MSGTNLATTLGQALDRLDEWLVGGAPERHPYTKAEIRAETHFREMAAILAARDLRLGWKSRASWLFDAVFHARENVWPARRGEESLELNACVGAIGQANDHLGTSFSIDREDHGCVVDVTYEVARALYLADAYARGQS